MAGELTGYAISIDEVRDIFGAAPDLAERLQSMAARLFPPPEPPETGLLSKIGPLFRRDPKLIVDPTQPTRDDVAGLLAGRYCPPERTDPAWTIMHSWLGELSFGSYSRPLTAQQFADWEFALAKAGLPSPYSIGALLRNDAQLPLAPPAGSSLGYAKHDHVLATSRAMAAVIDAVSPDYADAATDVLAFLSSFEQWGTQASSTGRQAPDLLVLWTRA